MKIKVIDLVTRKEAAMDISNSDELIDILKRHDLLINPYRHQDSIWYSQLEDGAIVVSKTLLRCALLRIPDSTKLQTDPVVCDSCGQTIKD